MDQITLQTKSGQVRCTMPRRWRVISEPPAVDMHQQAPGVADMVSRALDSPIGAPPLSGLVDHGATVALLIDDLTRPTPKKDILPVLLDRLRAAGAREQDVAIIVALGSHRPLSTGELVEALGSDTIDCCNVTNHNCHTDDLVRIGQLDDGTPVKIDSRAFAADVRVGIGSVFPHPMNGFGGGGKILMPGITDFEAIKHHHLRHTFRKGTGLGLLDGNTFHGEVVRLAKAGRLNFIVNTVCDAFDRPAGAVAGHFVAAHREGCRQLMEMCAFPVKEMADVTIISSFPYDEGPQIVKPLISASMLTKERGTIILAADLRTAFPEPLIQAFERYVTRCKGRELERTVDRYFDAGNLLMEDGPVDYNMALAYALKCQARCDVVVVSPDLGAQAAGRMGFGYAPTLHDAVENVAVCVPEARVAVIPVGGTAVPVMSGYT